MRGIGPEDSAGIEEPLPVPSLAVLSRAHLLPRRESPERYHRDAAAERRDREQPPDAEQSPPRRGPGRDRNPYRREKSDPHHRPEGVSGAAERGVEYLLKGDRHLHQCGHP